VFDIKDERYNFPAIAKPVRVHCGMRPNRACGTFEFSAHGLDDGLTILSAGTDETPMRNTSFAIAVIATCAATPALAQAQNAAPPNGPSRYTFSRVDDGFLRLDNLSGQVAFCSPHGAGWACQAVPEDRAALEKEIARLQDEVARLKTEVAGLRVPPADLSPPAKGGEVQIKLPSQEDIARARVAVENAWRRLVDMIVNFQKDMMRKG
jgi:hypothetical protein